ncbi:hypothetical protein vBBcePLY3_00013 [Bacillus phage vB_BceP_LY3]|uniref:Uncharacterized protein n=1 Tax=Bacillus phage vB_BceP_LY3 TaxID=2950458 RepID=A0A9Y1CXA8_9CAUD|nr:hypothetical protein vBBcePLY3_00013 [Bacillus phage vB_BceP_LY3]
MKKRERQYMKIKHSRFAKLIWYYDVTRNMTPKEKRLLKKGLGK